MKNENPLFMVVREEYILLFTRFYHSYQWTRDSRGDEQLEAYQDLKEFSTFPELGRIVLGEEKWYDCPTVVSNLASLLLVPVNS